MKPRIKLSRYWKGCKDKAAPFAQDHRWACHATGMMSRHDPIGFGPTPQAAFLQWLDKAAEKLT